MLVEFFVKTGVKSLPRKENVCNSYGLFILIILLASEYVFKIFFLRQSPPTHTLAVSTVN